MSAGSWLGTKNALYYCAQSVNSISSVLLMSLYTAATDSITAFLAHAPKKCRQSGNFQFDINSPFQNTLYPKTKDAFPKIQAWAWKVNSHFFTLYRDYSNSLTLSNASKLFWSWISINHIEVHKRRKFCHCLLTFFTKREIRHFHVVVVQWQQRNVQKRVMEDTRAKLLFCLVKLLQFVLPRRHCILNFPLFMTHCDPSKTEFSQCKLNCSCW